MIYVLYGQPSAGKTTLGKILKEHLKTPFIIDGDEFREMFTNKNYGKEGREENIRNANAVATYLNKLHGRSWSGVLGGVVMTLVNPYGYLREELERNNRNEVIQVLLISRRELKKEYHVKDFEVGDPNYIISTDRDVEETWENLKDLLKV